MNERGWRRDQWGEEEEGWEAGRSEFSWLSALHDLPPLTPAWAPLTRFDTHEHLPPDSVLQGVQVLANVDEHTRLDRFRLHRAEEAGKGELGLVRWARAMHPGA